MAMAALALIVANSPLADVYFHTLHMVTGPTLAPAIGPMTVHLWINDGAMALFFFLVGLEIKREWLDGHLASWGDRVLPGIAALAGMVVPAIIYLAVTARHGDLARGWAIPAATDIAFAIGVLALVGRGVPGSLRLFLTTVAIVDDMGAVLIIALAYTASISGPALLGAAVAMTAMWGLGRAGVRALWPYMLGFVALWYFVLLSGVHATIAGVLAAFMVPLKSTPGAPDTEDSPLHRLEHLLNPWVAYGVVPLFGFANAGVSFAGASMADIVAPLPLAVAAGLFLGKQIGVFGAIRLSVALKLAQRPAGATWRQVYGVAMLCGIGFTMSLFIGSLAFDTPAQIDASKIGVLAGSVASAILGYAILAGSRRRIGGAAR